MNLWKGFKYLVRHPIDFFRKWYQGYKRLTPTDYARAMVVGYLWGTIGLVMVAATMIAFGSYMFTVFILAMSWIQIHNYRKFKKQLDGLEKLDLEI